MITEHLKSRKAIVYSITFAAIVLLVFALFLGKTQSPQNVEIWFNQPISQIRGYRWTILQNEPAPSVAIYNVHLKMHLPDKSVLQTDAQCVYVDHENGIVSMVEIILLRKPVDYKTYSTCH